jgi:ribonuclease HI
LYPLPRTLGKILPRILSWKANFQKVVEIHARICVLEYLARKEDMIDWNTSDKSWISKFNLHPSHSSYSLQRSCWKLHSSFNFDHWIQIQPDHTLCFDGASKGKTGEACAGGALFELRGKTNNKVEAYALLKGIHLVKNRQIQTLNIVGDSKTIIRMMILGSDPKNMSLKRVIDRIRLFSRTLKVDFFHVLRGNNVKVDNMAKLAI